MNPTITEHDWRFPRRPDAWSKPQAQNHAAAHRKLGASAGIANNSNGQHIFREVNADLNRTYSAAKEGLLDSSLFPSLLDTGMEPEQSLEQMQQEDPLATQIWKFFSKTKQQLPHQDRMENLTWRMMAVTMRRKKQEEEERKNSARYLTICSFYSLLFRRWLLTRQFENMTC